MSRRGDTLPVDYFDELYRQKPDPWDFQTSEYEREKYDATLACLPRPRYERAFEAGCSIGVLTCRLADRVDALVACDASAIPLQHAKDRCSTRANVSFLQAAIPSGWPDGRFDLMIFSEVLYYLSAPDLASCAERVSDSLDRGGDLVMVHYTGATDYPLSGDAAATMFGEMISSFARQMESRQAVGYRLDVWRRT